MSGSAVYGFFGAIVFGLGHFLAPQPAGSVIVWTLLAVQLTWGSATSWRRPSLPFASAAMAIAAVTSALLALLATIGKVFPHLPVQWWMPVGALMLSSPLCMLVESRVHRAEWEQWRTYMVRKTAWDIFTGRHIPRLRDTHGRA